MLYASLSPHRISVKYARSRTQAPGHPTKASTPALVSLTRNQAHSPRSSLPCLDFTSSSLHVLTRWRIRSNLFAARLVLSACNLAPTLTTPTRAPTSCGALPTASIYCHSPKLLDILRIPRLQTLYSLASIDFRHLRSTGLLSQAYAFGPVSQSFDTPNLTLPPPSTTAALRYSP
jgi:hypothetical protein